MLRQYWKKKYFEHCLNIGVEHVLRYYSIEHCRNSRNEYRGDFVKKKNILPILDRLLESVIIGLNIQ